MMVGWADDADKCGTTHEWTALSIFSASVSAFLFVTTTALSFLIMLALLRGRNSCFSSAFYKIVLNIALSDFLTGVVGDTGALNFLIKEAYGIAPSTSEVYWVHVPLFLNGGASILTLSLLSIDRVLALLWPYRYRDGIRSWKAIATLASTWILSGFLTIVYFEIGYIKFLAVYAFTTVLFTGICLSMAAVTYRKKFAPAMNRIWALTSKGIPRTCDKYSYENQKRIRMERRVNSSFFITLALFFITYLPSCGMTIYMNSCKHCDCLLIHVLRDLTFLAIYLSALLRGINFVSRLLTIRRAIKEIFKFKEPSVVALERSCAGPRSTESKNRLGCTAPQIDKTPSVIEPENDIA